MRHGNRDDSEEKRRRTFEGDVFYEAYRRGLNPDRAAGCAPDCYEAGRSPEQCVDGFEAQRRRRYQQEDQEFSGES